MDEIEDFIKLCKKMSADYSETKTENIEDYV